jgi:hypothetical protein
MLQPQRPAEPHAPREDTVYPAGPGGARCGLSARRVRAHAPRSRSAASVCACASENERACVRARARACVCATERVPRSRSTVCSWKSASGRAVCRPTRKHRLLTSSCAGRCQAHGGGGGGVTAQPTRIARAMWRDRTCRSESSALPNAKQPRLVAWAWRSTYLPKQRRAPPSAPERPHGPLTRRTERQRPVWWRARECALKRWSPRVA